jgi:hypothetical protein
MSEINYNDIISILKIGGSDNYLYKSDLNEITKGNDDNLSWLLKFAYSFNDEFKELMITEQVTEGNVKENVKEKEKSEQMITELKNKVRTELKKKKENEQQQRQKKRGRLFTEVNRKILTDEEFIINKIFQNLSMNFPNIVRKTKKQKEKYKKELLQAFEGIDGNDDGMIDINEFVKLYNKKNPEQPLDLNNSNQKKK